jgi:hypothetical protein
MSVMNVSASSLERIQPAFVESVLNALEVMFLQRAELRKEPIYTPRVVNPMELGCSLLCSNLQHQSCILFGVHRSDLSALTATLGKTDFMLDALGELANVTAGFLLDHEEYIDCFGFMEQSTPLFMAGGGACIKKTSGIQAFVHSAGIRLFVGFAVWEQKPSRSV